MLTRGFYFAVFLFCVVLSLLIGGGWNIFADARAWITIAIGIAWACIEASLKANQFARRWFQRAWVAAGLIGMVSGITAAVFQYAHGRAGVWLDGWIIVVGLMVASLGLLIRFSAIRTLGQFFNHEIKIADNHRIIQSGLYRHLRHPSYAGLGLICLGIGLLFGSVLVCAMMFFALHVAFAIRIFVEEQTLLAYFGDEYRAYQQRTKRLIPFVW